MLPVPRVLAVCQGGPLDGLRFSVALTGEGEPQPFTVHGPDVELTYRPDVELDLHTKELHDRVFAGFELHDPTDLERGIVRGHHFARGAWIYRP